jgi:Arc/MetJ-type ribon-helix-helix transcriptional regulator
MDGEEIIFMPDNEKITINMSAVDLGKIDLLVQESLYSNRTDFIRTAIRNQLDKHSAEIQQSVIRNSYVIGALIYDKAEFEKYKFNGTKIKMNIVGYLHLADDISPELACQVVESIKVRGIFHASEKLKDALGDKIK